jgi:hypothetical protein
MRAPLKITVVTGSFAVPALPPALAPASLPGAASDPRGLFSGSDVQAARTAKMQADSSARTKASDAATDLTYLVLVMGLRAFLLQSMGGRPRCWAVALGAAFVGAVACTGETTTGHCINPQPDLPFCGAGPQTPTTGNGGSSNGDGGTKPPGPGEPGGGIGLTGGTSSTGGSGFTSGGATAPAAAGGADGDAGAAAMPGGEGGESGEGGAPSDGGAPAAGGDTNAP